jgi:DNA-binding response OmpR family regulator
VAARAAGQPQGLASDPRHVLVAEDDPDLCYLLRTTLEDAGFAVHESHDGPSALEVIAGQPVDIVLLDLGLPDMDGYEVLRELRLDSDLPVIVLSGRRSEVDRTAAFDHGADDYVTKPFSAVDLLARIGAVLRRARPTPVVTRLAWGDLLIDLRAREVAVAGRRIQLTPLEYELLRHLAANPGLAISREDFLREVWHSRSAWQDPETVTEHVRRLRGKLTAAGLDDDWITTIRGFGYRFDPPSVERPSSGPRS